jgi:hypothetical protein
MGRPSKLTDEVVTILLDSVAAGMPYELSCHRAGICYSTFRKWVIEGEKEDGDPAFVQFVEDLKRAEGDAVFMRLQNIEGAAINGQWQASAWMLERRHPEHFSRRDHVALGQDPDLGPVQVASKSSLTLLADPEACALATQLIARLSGGEEQIDGPEEPDSATED